MLKLILTLGDPNGLGPELVSRLQPDALCPEQDQLLLIGPESALVHHCQRNSRSVFWQKLDFAQASVHTEPGIKLLEPASVFRPAYGEPTVNGGLIAGQSLKLAGDLLLKKIFSGLVTGPLNKSTLNQAGFAFPGHTEFLAELSKTGPQNVCMHLCGKKLRVSLTTTHPRLKDVPDLITHERILTCLRLTEHFLKRLGLEDAEIAVCGLNPHAGENGQIGDEELRIIEPAIRQAREQGIKASGPFPGDTIFYHAAQGEYGAVLAMYHDQGLAPLKLLHFKQAVNITLGLPFVRTSVDHGTGYDLVQKNRADTSSLEQALKLARMLCQPNANLS
ncbi:MAG: 4-hydroxythreonine-4-phosphate dehydrogenase PdxA [Thermodesulfobacteriota bacterium]